jgi:hypothetical protein
VARKQRTRLRKLVEESLGDFEGQTGSRKEVCVHRLDFPLIHCWLIAATACVLFAAAERAQAQDARGRPTEFNPPGAEMETDRDSFTPATSSVGTSRVMIESSYSFIANRSLPDANSVPELLVRTGITDRFEVRLGWNYEAGGPTGAVAGSDLGDEDFVTEKSSKVLYGFKFEQNQQKGWVPESALIVEGYTPTSGPSSFSRLVIAEVFGWNLPNGWQWNSSLRYGMNNNLTDDFNQWAPSTVLKIPLGQRWNFHTEYFGIVTSGRTPSSSQQYISFGGHVLLTPNFELGGRFGFGLNDETAKFFNNIGFGWRF